jgi:DnaK suppressor protein
MTCSSFAVVSDASADAVLRAARSRARMREADLKRELIGIAESTAEVPDDEHDAEGSTVGYERARVAALLALAERELFELEAARGRVATGTYQCCQRCGAEIPAERLAALPATRICFGCATRESG